MEPIGTITNFYPFLTEKTREVVKTLLKDAEDFDDFVTRLIEAIEEQDVESDFVFLTALMIPKARRLSALDQKTRTQLRKYELTRPWSYFNLEDPFVFLNYTFNAYCFPEIINIRVERKCF